MKSKLFKSVFASITRAKLHATIVALILILIGGPAKLRAAVDFVAPKSYSVGSTPSGIAVGDFNGDGKIDIAVANTGSENVSILLGNGDGTFQTAVNFGTGNSPSVIAIGDFNGDGKLDLAAFEPGNAGNGSVSILLGNGDGTFQSPKTLILGAVGLFMAVADFNLDKKSDLAVGNSVNIDVYIGNGDGTFQSPKETSTFSPRCLGFVAADFNGDSKPDLALVSSGGVQILLGMGDGTLTKGPLVTTFASPESVIAADLRQDGKMDLLVMQVSESTCALSSCVVYSTRMSVFLGNGDGSFQGESVVAQAHEQTGSNGPIGSRIDYILLGDFNGDGRLDMAYRLTPANRALNPSLGFLLGRGDGSLSSTVSTFSLPGGATPVGQDLNADKLTDLVAPGGANSIDVWLNTSPASGTDLGLISPSSSPEPVTVRSNLTFTVDVVNLGPQAATGVVFMDTLPGSTNFVSATSSVGSCVQSNGVVSCTVGSLASAADSKVSIVVTPTTAGSITDSMSVSGNEPDPVPANNNAMQVADVITAANFTLSPASMTLTTQTGAQVTDILTLVEQNGFSGQVKLSCTVTGATPLAACAVSPSSVTLGSSPGSAMLTITAPASLSAFVDPMYRGHGIVSFAVVLPISSLLLAGVAFGFRRPKKHWIRLWLVTGSLIVFSVVCGGCGGNSMPPLSKTYIVTVTATSASGSQQQSASINLTVQ